MPSGQVWKYYYYAGGQPVAVRVTGSQNPQENGLFYTLGDQIGSTSVIVDYNGVKLNEMRYMPWGEDRYYSGNIPTDRKYTGQREDKGIGLYYYNARWYDKNIQHFIQTDTIIPSPMNPSSWDHYSYVKNNPIANNDPSGHCKQGESCWDTYLELMKLNQTLNLQDLERMTADDLDQLLNWSRRGVILSGDFSYWSAKNTIIALNDVQYFCGSKTNAALGLTKSKLTIRWGLDDNYFKSKDLAGQAFGKTNTIAMSSDSLGLTTLLHEICHIIDYNIGDNEGGNYSGKYYIPGAYTHNKNGTWTNHWYDHSQSGQSLFNPTEDFADSLLVMIMDYANQAYPNTYLMPDLRRQWDIRLGISEL
jgi:RHS repeat-associated protein